MFFTSISQMMTESVDLTLVIRKANGQLTVSTLPKANGLKDEAANHIIPLTLTGTPEEMDAEFLQHIMQPIRKATGLISNLMEFEKQADKAAANSKAAKDAKAKETKEEKEKREKYEKHMKKAEELITAKNHKDAITALQQARMYATADKQKEVDEKIAAQRKAMNQGSLFEMMEETPAPAPQVAQPQNVAPQPAQQTIQPQAAPRHSLSMAGSLCSPHHKAVIHLKMQDSSILTIRRVRFRCSHIMKSLLCLKSYSKHICTKALHIAPRIMRNIPTSLSQC